MKKAVDLHIHTALSPCGDDDMTPNNIVNMAAVCELDAIAITDHNTAGNCEAAMEVGVKTGITVIPGIELMTAEEVHLVCLFPTLEKAVEMGKIIREAMPAITNKPQIFGNQLFFNGRDEIVGNESLYLLSAVSFDIETACKLVGKLAGKIIPAHINRDSYSILANLGAIPEEYGFTTLELSSEIPKPEFRYAHPEFDKYKIIQSSDSHYLHTVSDRTCIIECRENSVKGILEAL